MSMMLQYLSVNTILEFFQKEPKMVTSKNPPQKLLFSFFLTTKAFSRNQIELSKANDINPPPKNFSKKENKPEIW